MNPTLASLAGGALESRLFYCHATGIKSNYRSLRGTTDPCSLFTLGSKSAQRSR